MTRRPNPLIPGFAPDPSVVRVDGVYYLVTSTFEYLPGLPVYRSTDLVEWEHIANVAERPEQVLVGCVATGSGVVAPTIRHRDGLFYVIVTVIGSGRGCVVFTAPDPAGPWSHGRTIKGIHGIAPDLAWDDEGTAYVTYCGLRQSGDDGECHYDIEQVRVDLAAGQALEDPRLLWSGSGLRSPAAPHLYRRGDYWYLVIAGCGDAVSVAGSASPTGPFTGHPANPLLRASGSPPPVQNIGRADLVETPEGGWALVLAGMRTLNPSKSSAPLGAETFITDVTWTEDGWPAFVPVEVAPRTDIETTVFSFEDEAALEDPGWLSVRTTPRECSGITDGHLQLLGYEADLDDVHPVFVGRRQRHLNAKVATTVNVFEGVGGLASRYDEHHHFGLTAATQDGAVVVTAWCAVAGLRQEWQRSFPAGPIELVLEMRSPAQQAALRDRVRLLADGELLAELDGRHWMAESSTSLSGRIIGLHATDGEVLFADFRYTGWDAPPDPG